MTSIHSFCVVFLYIKSFLVLLKQMFFRLNQFLWLHLIPQKFNFQFQSNPDDKYQPAPFHRNGKYQSVFCFFASEAIGSQGTACFAKTRTTSGAGSKKTKYDIFLEKIWKENFVLWVFHLETLRALPSEFQIGQLYSLLLPHLANFDYLPSLKV